LTAAVHAVGVFQAGNIAGHGELDNHRLNLAANLGQALCVGLPHRTG
jgi:hypothetical protein